MKRVFIAVVIVLTLLAIPATMFLVVRSQELRKRAAPATTLSLSPASLTKKVGDEFTLEVQIDTAGNQVVAAELHLVYDPTKLEAVTITNGSLFPNVLASGTIDSGTASITVGATSATTPITGTGTATAVKFRALEATTPSTTVKFASNTFVGALSEGSTNVLIGTTPATVTIAGESNIGPSITPKPTEITAPLSPASPSSQLTVNDKFDGNILNAEIWNVYRSSASSTASLSAGKLNIATQANHEYANSGVKTIAEVKGDFQTQVTVDSLRVPVSGTGSAHFYFSAGEAGIFLKLEKDQNNLYLDLSTIPTSGAQWVSADQLSVEIVFPLTLKLVKTGTSAQAFADSGSGFKLLGSLTNVYNGKGSIWLGTEIPANSSGEVAAVFDNFSLTSSVSPSGGQVSSPALEILSPTNDATVPSQPTLKGKATPGSTVTITIYSEPITVTVTADSGGNWSYTPPNPLEPGPHNVVASAQDPTTGTTKTATTTFVVAAAGEAPATESATPIAGNPTLTIVFIILGGLLLLTGITLPRLLK